MDDQPDQLARRLRDAGSALEDLRGAIVAGEPWPLSPTWGIEPEADWGPREVLGHVNEMVPYWTEQLGAVLAGSPAAAVPFGRVAADPSRLARIGADRERTSSALLDEIGTRLEPAAEFIGGLTATDGERLGRHSSRGEITVRASIERFLVGHLEEHVEQLRSILARRSA